MSFIQVLFLCEKERKSYRLFRNPALEDEKLCARDKRQKMFAVKINNRVDI